MLAYKNARLGGPLPPNELDDVTQESLIVVWRKLGEYSGAGSLDAWVWRISYLELLSQLRRRGRFPGLLEDLDPVERDSLGSDDVDPLENEHLYRTLERLGPPDAVVLRLKHLEGLTFQEVAERLETPLNTVKSRYYRGLVKMRRYLSGDDEEPEVEQ